jgi:hypothetical protein
MKKTSPQVTELSPFNNISSTVYLRFKCRKPSVAIATEGLPFDLYGDLYDGG